MKTIEQLLASAEHTANWWQNNKSVVDGSWKFWGKCEKVCAVFGITLLSGLCGLVVAQGNNWITYEMVASVGKLLPIAFFGALFASGFGKICIEVERSDLVAHRYKDAVDAFGFDPKCEYQQFTQQQRAMVIKALMKLGANSQQIIALRDLELPNSWWRTINHLIETRAKENLSQEFILEDVYVQVERSIDAQTSPSKLRL